VRVCTSVNEGVAHLYKIALERRIAEHAAGSLL